MGKIMMNGIQYGVGGITDADDIKYTDSQTVKGALDEVKSGVTNLSNAFIVSEFNWRAYANIQAALTANASTLFAKTGTHVLTAITSGGVPHILALISMSSGYIGGIHQSYASAPERIYSTDNGSTWTVGGN